VTIKSILVLGSGPIKIGQAAEFDYAEARPARHFTRKVTA